MNYTNREEFTTFIFNFFSTPQDVMSFMETAKSMNTPTINYYEYFLGKGLNWGGNGNNRLELHFLTDKQFSIFRTRFERVMHTHLETLLLLSSVSTQLHEETIEEFLQK